MAIQLERLLDWPFSEIVQHYTERDVMFYALSLGFGLDSTDRDQLRYVYEGHGPAVFPTMAGILCHPGLWMANPDSGIQQKKVVHGAQRFEFHHPLRPSGTVRGKTKVAGVVDKGPGAGALIYQERKIWDGDNGTLLATMLQTSFARGDGGFGGPTGPVVPPATVPEAAPDLTVHMSTPENLALLYRLNADRNPLHADPDVAKAAGFSRPILHGMCTFGIAAHAIVKSAAGYDHRRLRSIEARFSSPVYPGEALRFDVWRQGTTVSFQGWAADRNVKILDNGLAEIGDSSEYALRQTTQ